MFKFLLYPNGLDDHHGLGSFLLPYLQGMSIFIPWKTFYTNQIFTKSWVTQR